MFNIFKTPANSFISMVMKVLITFLITFNVYEYLKNRKCRVNCCFYGDRRF